MVTDAGSYFLQMFLWERFPSNVPKPMEFLVVVIEEITLEDGSRGTRYSNTYKPRAWIWLNTKHHAKKSIIDILNKEESLCFKPCLHTRLVIMRPALFGEVNEELELMPQETYSGRTLTLLDMARTLVYYKLELGEEVFCIIHIGFCAS